MAEEKAYFFKPYEPPKYQEGIKGIKILVLGASFYCSNQKCDHFKECTNETKMNSISFNDKCSDYIKNNYKLDQMPKIEIEGYRETHHIKSYAAFTLFMDYFLYKYKFIEEENFDLWDFVAFTNYVQFVLPHYETKSHNIIPKKYNKALESIITEKQPNIVICWGGTINRPLWEHDKQDKENTELLKNSEYYRFRWIVNDQTIEFINPFHPSSNSFIMNYHAFEKYLLEVFQECEKKLKISTEY